MNLRVIYEFAGLSLFGMGVGRYGTTPGGDLLALVIGALFIALVLESDWLDRPAKDRSTHAETKTP